METKDITVFKKKKCQLVQEAVKGNAYGGQTGTIRVNLARWRL